ncbi:MAG: zinc transporter ZntB [Gammaproteobacteria bacterium]
MAKEESLVAAYLLDGKGGGQKIGWREIEAWQPEQGLIWIHLNFTGKKSRNWLLKRSQLHQIVAQAMLTEDTRPRSAATQQGLFVSLRGVNLNPGQDPEDMVGLRIWLDKHRVITTRRRRLLSIDDLRQAIEMGNGPKTTGELLVAIATRLTVRMSDALEDLDEHIDDIEEMMLTGESHQLRPRIAETRRDAIAIRRYLSPQREALQHLHMDHNEWLDAGERLAIREINDRVIRYVENLDTIRERAAICQEELTNRLAEQMNKRMYLLSIIAVIFLPLTFITGLFGINVAGIPIADKPWAFNAICSLLMLLGLVTLVIFWRKKWL